MHRGISVIITVRGQEPYLKQTIANIRAKIGCPFEIITVWDGTKPDVDLDVDQIIHIRTGKGVGPARHAGIKKASNDLIFLTDAHMDFSQGFGNVILEWHNQSDYAAESHLSCGKSIALSADGKWDYSHNGRGCRFTYKMTAPENQKWIMAGRWKEQGVNGLIGCVYGACYAFSKEWYKKIGSPLQVLKEWGMDEEILSAATWLAGGKCALLNYEVAHFFKHKKSTEIPDSVKHQFLINQLLFLHLLPLPDASRLELETWLRQNPLIATEKIAKTKQIAALRELWHSWDWSKLGRWIDYPAKETAPIMAERPRKQPELLTFSKPTAIPFVPRRRARL